MKMQALSLGMRGGGSGSALAYQKEGRRPHVYCMQKSQSRAVMAVFESVVSQLFYSVKSLGSQWSRASSEYSNNPNIRI